MLRTNLRIGVLLAVTLCWLALGIPAAAQTAQGEAVTVTDAFGEEVAITDTSRIVTIGGPITEIVYALGAADRVVARDDSSSYPPAVNELPSVGYVRRLSAEPVLSLEPTLILASDDIGPPEAVEQLQAAGVTLLAVPGDDSLEGVITRVRTVAAALGREEAGEELVAGIEASYAAAQSLLESVESRPRVMFIYARGAGAVSVSGTDTSAHAMIELAENAVTGYEGYQPITSEAVVTAAPDVILMMRSGLDSLGGVQGLLEQPGIAQTPAGENGRIIAVDGLYLLGFSTRTGRAILDLTYLLHEELEAPLITLLRTDGRFHTLLRALDVAGQTDRLADDGAYTLFAPTDDALAAALPADALEGFLSSTISVQATVAYHLLEGRYPAADLAAMDGQSVATLYSGGELLVEMDGDTLLLNGQVSVVEADHEAANGVLHVIDGVLLPERP